MGFSHTILAIEAEGDRVVDLKLEGCRPNIRPDGKKICWGHGDFCAGVADLDLTSPTPTATQIHNVVESKDPIETYHVTWSPDMKYLTFTRGPKFKGKNLKGLLPEFPGIERFAGRVVHPQKWPADLDYVGKRVVVIGSGATAVTLVPAMAKDAAHVTMLQRSPTYIVSLPGEDPIANWLRRRLPARVAYGITRWKNVLLTMWFFRFCRRHPKRARTMIAKWVRKELGSEYDVGTHFNPRYNPWEQRLCLVPDSDLFAAMRQGRASVVTDEIATFTAKGLQLRSGAELEADVVVTATGLNLLLLGGLEVTVDGVRVDFAKTYNYKGMMFSDVPNLALAVGYTNASWTLKAELICRYVCRLLNHMEKTGMRQCTPHARDGALKEAPFLDLTSGYVQRSIHLFPKQGSKIPWKLHQNYARDLLLLRRGTVDDGVMEFSNPTIAPARRDDAAELVAGGRPLHA